MPTSLFDQLKTEIASGDVAKTFDCLAGRLIEEKRFHELFDVRLMQARHRLGLPVILTTALEELPEAQQRQVEEASLEACREVGQMLLDEGQIGPAWMYLRAAGENESVVEALAAAEIDEENMEDLIGVALHEGVDPKRGFGWILEQYGTCNAITTYESDVSGRSDDVQQFAIDLLARRLSDDLLENVRSDIAQQEEESDVPAEASLSDLIADRDWLFGEHNYHVDTTHLASVVRFARKAASDETRRLVLQMCLYGKRLSKEFRFDGEEPFKDYYVSHELYFQAVLGENVEAAIEYFRQRAESVDVEEEGALAVDVYVKLLADAGRHAEAIDATVRLIPQGVHQTGSAPSLLELSRQCGNYDRLMGVSEERGDVLSFVAGLVEEKMGKRSEELGAGI
jgi:hypothetical protein